MIMKLLLLAIAAGTAFAQSAADESAEGLRVVLAPTGSGLKCKKDTDECPNGVAQSDNGEYPHREALFGVPPYGSKIRGMLVYATPGDKAHGCPPGKSMTKCTQDTDCPGDGTCGATKTCDGAGYSKPTWPDGEDAVFMVDRSDCLFIDKVRYAESLGAAAVIIVDNQCMAPASETNGPQSTEFQTACSTAFPGKHGETFLPYMADGGSGSDIDIPSYLISKWDGQKFKDCLKDTYPAPANDPDTTFTGTSKVSCADQGGGAHIYVELEWRMPAPDNNVEWEMWTSSDDESGTLFKKQFKDTAVQLAKLVHSEESGSTTFDPHFFFYPPPRGCGPTDTSKRCKDQCTNQERYCYVDPDNQIGKGVSGADVVQENLRQLCVWEQAKNTLSSDGGVKWWDYAIQFAAECKGGTGTISKSFGKDCSERVHGEVGLSWTTTMQCVTDSGGYSTTDGVNTKIAAEIKARTGQQRGNIFTLPSIIVNNVIERGGTKPDAVLAMICAGFLDGTAPDELCDPEAKKDAAFAEKLIQANSAIMMANEAANKAKETADAAQTVVASLQESAAAAKEELGTLRQASIDAKNAATEAQKQADKKVGMASIVMIVIVSMLVLGTVGFLWHRRSQKQQRQEVTGMLAQYFTPLADGAESRDPGRIENPIEFPSRGPAFQPPPPTSAAAALKDLAKDAKEGADPAGSTEVTSV